MSRVLVLVWAVVGLGLVPPPVRGQDLPKVVLVGDGTRLGYASFVKVRLAGFAEVVSVEENGGDSANLLKHLDAWVISQRPAVVHFNVGHHDLKLDPESGEPVVRLSRYRANLQEILKRLEERTSAHLIFATTTPVLDKRQNPLRRREADVEAYNEVALEVLKPSFRVSINDLHNRAMRLGLPTALGADGIHFTREAYSALAEQVFTSVIQALQKTPVTRAAACYWADRPPVIDGTLNEASWQPQNAISRFASFWDGKERGQGMKAWLTWDNDALYYAARMPDAELRSVGLKRNDTLWNGDVFELFFKPDEGRPQYYEFQVNPRSVILELAFPRRGFDFDQLAAGPPLGMEAKAQVAGTVNNPDDRDRNWIVEGRIPWTAFSPTGGRPGVGTAWRFALCRYDHGADGTAPVLMSTAPLSRASFHRYEDYGVLRFEGPR